jgi:hypothetical protein
VHRTVTASSRARDRDSLINSLCFQPQLALMLHCHDIVGSRARQTDKHFLLVCMWNMGMGGVRLRNKIVILHPRHSPAQQHAVTH